ncbi:MAG: protein kinase [Chloroflexi bacterium]|nr:protein kinase [Chloroflexota bacterium]
MEDLSGQIIKGYELHEMIGAGGFGAVYRAHQAIVDREVAIKIILPHYASQADFIRRFESEAHLVARLEHIHIVPLYDYWRDPSGAYLIMRWLRGGSLQGHIKKFGAWSPELAAHLLDQIAAALMVSHRHKVIHRDLKPANILLDEDHNAYLTDFGIAKDLGGGDSRDEGGVIGSPAYMSPEQIRSGPITPQTDIYGLGMVMYEVLTGEQPFAGTTASDLIIKQLGQPLPELRELRSDLPGDLNRVLQKATAKDPTARYLDALSFAKEFRRAIGEKSHIGEAGTLGTWIDVEDSDEIFISISDSTTRLQITGEMLGLTIPLEISNPYKGLKAFQEADADDFFGREILIQHLIHRMNEKHSLAHFLAVVGPSGSGKSSVVKAGVLPALRKNAIPGSSRWFVAEMTPSSDPIGELETALLRIAAEPPPDMAHRLRDTSNGLLELLPEVLPDYPNCDFLLVIDQFEEVFTQVEKEVDRAHFLDSLRIASSAPNIPFRVVITLRADFYDRPLLYPEFGALVRERTEVVLPLSTEELERAIAGPAERIGMNVEAALIASIIADVREEPGTLPLLQYALTEVFERRQGKTLTLEAYQVSGGALGALARRAEDLFMEMPEDEQLATRQLFMRLVTLGEGTEDTRRRARWAEMISMSGDAELVRHVLEKFAKFRLFTLDNDPQTREPTVEVAHEALIRQWRRLREWLDDSREDLRMQRRLTSATEEWLNQKKDPSFLANGVRLQQFEALANSGRLALTQQEIEYIQSSVTEHQRQMEAEKNRQERELALVKQGRDRLRVLLIGASVAAIVTLILAIFAFNQRSVARDNEAQAKSNERRAIAESNLRATAQAETQVERDQALANESRLLANLSLQQLAVDPVAALDLSLRALPSVSTPRPYVPQAEFALTRALQVSMERAYLQAFEGSIRGVAFDNGQIAVGGSGLILVEDQLKSDSVTSLTGHERTVQGVEWGPNHQLLSYDDQTVRAWQNGTLINTYTADQQVLCATWQPTADVIAICAGQNLFIWAPATNTVADVHLFNAPIQANSAAWSPNGRWLAAWDSTAPGAAPSTVIIWDSQSGEIVVENNAAHTNTINSAAWSPDSQTFVTVSADFTAQIWQTNTDPVALTGHIGNIVGVRFVDDTRFVTWGEDGTARLWNTAGEALATFGGGTVAINMIYPSPDSSKILLALNDGTGEIWDIASAALVTALRDLTSVIQTATWRDENGLATGNADSQIRIWNATTGRQINSLLGHQGRLVGLRWLDSQQLQSYSQDGSLRIWRVFDANDVPQGRGIELVLAGHTNRIENAEWLDDNTIISNGRDGTARKWSLDTGASLVLENESGDPRSIVWNPDANRVLAYVPDADGKIWDLATQTALLDIPGPIFNALWLDEGILITRQTGETLLINPDDGQRIVGLEGHTAPVNDAQVYGTTLATAGADSMIYLWDLSQADGGLIAPTLALSTDGRQPVRLQWSADGTRLLSGGFNGDVRLWDAKTGEVLLFLTENQEFPARSVRFSPDEQYIAAPVGEAVFVWNMAGELIWQTNAHNDSVLGLDWYQNGDTLRLLTWGADGTARLWDFPSGVEVLRLTDTDGISEAGFNSTGTQIMTAGRSGTILVWQAWPNVDAAIADAESCCRTRPLSEEQKAAFNIAE